MSNLSEKRLAEIMLFNADHGDTTTCIHYGINAESLNRYKRLYCAGNKDKTIPKVLILDIETAPMKGFFWQLYKPILSPINIDEPGFILSWSAKWLFSAKMMSDIVTSKEALKYDDKRIMKPIWKLLDDADVVIGHNCVGVNTPVLKQDLTWVKAGKLRVGDKLVGFDEKVKPGKRLRDGNKWIGVDGTCRKIKPAVVEEFCTRRRLCMKVIFDNGDEIITTKDHYWLGMAEKDRNQRWYKTENLRIGQRINKHFNVWNENKSYEAGWLSGFIAGEGSLKQSGFGFGVDFCQRPGSTWNQALDFCEKLNIPTSLYRAPKTGGLGKQDTLYTGFLGGKFKIAEHIGRLQIKRFIEKIDWNNFGGLKSRSTSTRTIIDIIDVGYKNVAVIATNTATFIGGGYPMHNCRKFDIKWLNTEFILNGFKPPMPYQTIDTLVESRKHFKFPSNQLTYLGKMLVRKQKLATNFDLWKRCKAGKQEALDYMLKYNKEDVLLLEDVYVEMRPWIKSHPNMALYTEGDGSTCGHCTSPNLLWEDKYYTTMVSRFAAYRCKDCGAPNRCRTTSLSKERREKLLVSIAR